MINRCDIDDDVHKVAGRVAVLVAKLAVFDFNRYNIYLLFKS